MKIRLNLCDLEEQLKYYYILTGCRMVIFDENHCELVAYPKQNLSFCEEVRKNPTINELCKNCDKTAFKIAKETKSIHTYCCHLGLIDTIFPIFDKNKIIGFCMSGQILNEHTDHSMQTLRTKLEEYDYLPENFEQLYETIPVFSTEKITAISKTMEITAKHLYLEKKISLECSPLAQSLEDYLVNNLDKPLTSKFICDKFFMNKSSLYRLSQTYFGTGISQYIETLRIQEAKRLLKDTDLPISEIATAVGISDYNYFTKIFKKITKSTPLQFRKN